MQISTSSMVDYSDLCSQNPAVPNLLVPVVPYDSFARSRILKSHAH
jgi:hypothetical protein